MTHRIISCIRIVLRKQNPKIELNFILTNIYVSKCHNRIEHL